MRRVLSCLALIALWSPGGSAADRLIGVIVDTAGVQTEVTDLTSDVGSFGGSWFGAQGLSVTVKEFKPPFGDIPRYSRWLYFDQIDSLSVAEGGTAAIRLRTGATITGALRSPSVLRGNWTGGQFELSVDKVKSLTVRGAVKRPVVPVQGPKATIVLRDGTTLKAEDVRRHCYIMSGYVNVAGRDEHYASVWIRYKRGEGFLRSEVPFERIRQIAFDTSPGALPCKVSLQDGSVLSGECSAAGGSSTPFQGLTGRLDIGPFFIEGNVAHAIQVIRFAE